MNKKVIITGATGLIGKKLACRLIERGDEVTVFTRSIANAKVIIPKAASYIKWEMSSKDWIHNLEGKDAVIHLSGESLIGKRWTHEQKKKIYDSRILSTRVLVGAMNELSIKPKLFISASAVGYYGNSETEVDETSPAGKGFLAEVVRDWELASEPLDNSEVRRVVVRIGVVLDKNEGALAKMVLPFKLFVGGPLGSGKQWMPWIHIEDLVSLFLYAIDNENVEGILNGVSPNPVRMSDFAKAIGSVIRRPSFFKVPSFILKLILGEASSIVLEGAKVVPTKASNYGFQFEYKEIQTALNDLLK